MGAWGWGAGLEIGGHGDRGTWEGRWEWQGWPWGNDGVGSGGSPPKGGFPLGLRCWGLLKHPWELVWSRAWGQR